MSLAWYTACVLKNTQQSASLKAWAWIEEMAMGSISIHALAMDGIPACCSLSHKDSQLGALWVTKTLGALYGILKRYCSVGGG